MQRKSLGLSNGIVLKDQKRSCNFETGEHLKFYEALLASK